MAKKNQPPNKVFKAITKTRTETRMKHPKEMVNEIIAWYDFNAVQKVMEQLEMWGDEDRVPTAEELKSKAYILLKNSLNTILYEYIAPSPQISMTMPVHEGKFQAIFEVDRGEITDISLHFILESWDAEAFESLEFSQN